MVSVLNWEAALSGPTTLHSTSLNGLSSNTLSAASSAFDNTTNLDTLFFLELVTAALGLAPAAGELVRIYAVHSLDGTNYSDAPATGGSQDGDRHVISFPYKAATSARRFTSKPLVLMPCLYKFYVDNRLSQAFAASGNTLKIWSGNLENQ